MEYRSLNELLQEHSEAVTYFSDLPDEVREYVSSQPHSINSLEDLKNIAKSYSEGGKKG